MELCRPSSLSILKSSTESFICTKTSVTVVVAVDLLQTSDSHLWVDLFTKVFVVEQRQRENGTKFWEIDAIGFSIATGWNRKTNTIYWIRWCVYHSSTTHSWSCAIYCYFCIASMVATVESIQSICTRKHMLSNDLIAFSRYPTPHPWPPFAIDDLSHPTFIN